MAAVFKMQHVINSNLNLKFMCCFYVQVSISGQALVFVVRTSSHSFFDAAGVLTYVAFFGAQVRLMRATMIIVQRSKALSCHRALSQPVSVQVGPLLFDQGDIPPAAAMFRHFVRSETPTSYCWPRHCDHGTCPCRLHRP